VLRALLLAGILLMADGINQSAPLATITVQNDLHADADLDGVLDEYWLDDIVAKGLASGDVTDLGTTAEKSFRCKASIQNGDGVGTLATTLRGKNCSVEFDTGKTLLVSATGQANRKLELGTLVQGAAGKPSGKDGCKIVLGTATTIRGCVKLYGSYLRTTAGNLGFIPGASGLGGDMVNTILQAAGSLIIGQFSTGYNFARVYNLDMIGTNAAGGIINNWGVDYAERITVALGGASAYFASTGAKLRIKDPVLIGTPTVADFKNSGIYEWDLVNLVPSGNAPQYDNQSTQYINEWGNFGVMTVDPATGAIVSGVPIQILDAFGTELINDVTDADGHIEFGTVGDVTENALKIRRLKIGVYDFDYFYPLTVNVNLTGTPLPGWLGHSYKFNWPYRSLPSGYGRQYLPVMEIIYMRTPSAPSVPPATVYFDQLLVEAAGEERIVTVTPERC
jgi:hypothetical protein